MGLNLTSVWFLLCACPETAAQDWFSKWGLDFCECSTFLKIRSILCKHVVLLICRKTTKKFWWKTSFLSSLLYRQHVELPLRLWIHLHPFTINPNGTNVASFFFFSEQKDWKLQNIQCLNRSHYISYTKSLLFIYRGLDFFSLSCNIKIGRHTQGWHGFDKKLMICTSL